MKLNRFHSLALEFDKKDPLSMFREQFECHGEIYLDGNSLGKLPKRTNEVVLDLIKNQWGKRKIRSWNENWMELPTKIAAKIAKIVGARADEIFVCDNTSVNFYKLAFAALYYCPTRTKIVSDSLNFPTDLYVLQGLIEQQFNGHTLKIIESSDEIGVTEAQISAEIDDKTSLLTLSHVVFKSAFMYDMKKINTIAHQQNALVLWDLSHAAGAVPIYLNDSNADLAVGCTYKYLNGGPGAPAFLYVRKDLQEKLLNPIWAWFSHEKPFDFKLNYKANQNINRFSTGTPSVISLAAIEPGLDVTISAGIENLRRKSVLQSTFLLEMIEQYLVPVGFKVASPPNVYQRGSHISIQHSEGYRINRAMIEPFDGSKIIIPDFRPPNNIRIGIAPLYNTFLELYETITRIKLIVVEKQYEHFDNEKLEVT